MILEGVPLFQSGVFILIVKVNGLTRAECGRVNYGEDGL